MYRIFRSKRGKIDMFNKAHALLAFDKEQSSLFGLVMKSILLRSSYTEPYSGYNGSIY